MRTVIRWTPDEWDQVVEIGARLFLNGEVDSEIKAFQAANGKMPLLRQRVFSGENKLYPSMYKDWTARWPETLKRVRKQIADEITAIEAQSQQQQQAAETKPAAIEQPALVVDPTAAAAATLLTQALMSAFLDALESPRGQAAIRKAFEVPCGVPDEQFKVEGLSAIAPVVKRQRKVLIVGLLGSQQEEIKRDFGQKLDLRFLPSEIPTKQARENAKSVDVTFGMVSYMSHPLDGALNKAAVNYRRVNGTVSDLKRLMYHLTNTK